MSSPSGFVSGVQGPRLRLAPPRDETDGDLCADLVSGYGLAPDPWQRLVLDDWLARKDGRYAALDCGLAVPRQNGKNALLEMRELYGAVGLGERILHTAHQVKTAMNHFKRLEWFFGESDHDPHARFPALNELVVEVRRQNGHEGVFLKNGGAIELSARSKNAARGFTVDVLVMDEAQELDDDALEALLPTISSAPLRDPQTIMVGTPPGPNAAGETFLRRRRNSLLNRPKRTSWLEWSVPDGPVDLDDRDLWRSVNPALLSGRLQMAVIEGERKTFSSDGFLRERLGRFPPLDAGHGLISDAEWSATEATPPADGIKSFGVAFSFDGKRCALAGAVKHPGGVFVELIDEPKNTGALADWLCAGDEPRWKRAAQIVISGAAGASLSQGLLDRGVPRRVLISATTHQYIEACSMFLDGVRDGSVTHPAQAALDDSRKVSGRKDRGSSGGWGWVADEPGDEVPMEAVTVAAWAARTSKRHPGRKAKAVIL